MKTLSVAHEEKALPGKISEILLLDTLDRACLKNGQHLTQNIFMRSPFKNWCFWFPYILNFLQKKQEIKQSWFLVNSCCFCFAFHANLMSDGKKKTLTFLFITPLPLLINMSVSLFRWTVQLIKSQKFFDTNTTKLCSITLVRKIIEFYRYTKNEQSKHLIFFLRFSIIDINLSNRESI